MKKVLLATVSALMVFALAACSGGSTDIATMKGGKISVEDFYDKTKTDSSSQTTIRNMIIFKVFDEKYGDKVSDKDLDAKYNEEKEKYGDTFDSALSQAGYTTKTFKQYLKENMALEEGLKSHVKLTDADLKTAWESFHPEVEAQIITATSEDDAKAIKEEVSKEGADFAKIAKEKSTDTATKEDGGKVKFDSSSTTIPAEVQTAAYKLKDGEISDVITTTDASTYMPVFYIVKMTKTQAKGNDMKPFEDKLKEIATETKLADSTFTAKVIGTELKEANVKIKDDSLSNILSSFIEAAETKDSSTAESSTKESAAKDSSAKESSTEESKTAESSTTESSK